MTQSIEPGASAPGSRLSVELDGALSGHSITVDLDALDFGLLEDFDSGRVKPLIDSMARVVVDWTLPGPVTRDAIRSLKPAQGRAIVAAITGAVRVPNGN